MRKKIIIMSMLLTGALSAGAYEYGYLTFQNVDGSQASVAVEELTLSVADGNLVATNGSSTRTFPLASLAKMYFTAQPTVVTDVKAQGTGAVRVYDASGKHRGQYASEADALGSLGKGGVYILKGDGETGKTVSK